MERLRLFVHVLLLVLLFQIKVTASNFNKECSFKRICDLCRFFDQSAQTVSTTKNFFTKATSPGQEILIGTLNVACLTEGSLLFSEFQNLCFSAKILVFKVNTDSLNSSSCLPEILASIRKNKKSEIIPLAFICTSRSRLTTQIELNGFMYQKTSVIDLHEHVYFINTEKTRVVELAVNEDKSEETCDILEAYSILNQTRIVQSVSVEKQSDDHNLLAELIRTGTRRSDLRGQPIKAVAQNDSVYESSVKMEIHNGTLKFVSGSHLQIVHDYQFLLNFTIEPIAGTGWIGVNDTLTGMGEQILTGEADISIMPSSVAAYRAKKLYFIPSVLFTESWGFYREQTILESNIFALPFESSVWFSILLLGLVFLVTVVCIQRCTEAVGTEFGESGFAHLGFWLFRVFCLKGSTSPTNVTLRILCFIVLLASFFILTLYTAAFVAAMSAPKAAITSYKDFEKYGFVVFTNPNYPNYAEHFLQARREASAAVQTIINNSDRIYVSDVDVALKLLDPTRRYAYLINSDGFFQAVLGRQNLSTQDLCTIAKLKNSHGQKIMGSMFMKKGSPFQELISHRTTVLIERGLMDRYTGHFLRDTSIQCLKSSRICVRLNFEQCRLAYEILIGGAVLTFFVLCFEKNYKLSRKLTERRIFGFY